MLEHGGRLLQAARRYGIAAGEWLDLSTGVNPNGWPVPLLPATAWSRLPENDDGLEAAACAYYGTQSLLPVAGSQAAIQALPLLRSACRVGVLSSGYAEHAHAWRRVGHATQAVAAAQVEDAITQVDVLVLIHPNNPTAARFAPQQLLDWHAQLAARAGWLIVDEAFVDATPDASLAPFCPRPGLIVLRSLGKFFGLAGARVGFALAPREILQRLEEQLGPWTVSGPARVVAILALQDRAWQTQARARLIHDAQRLQELLRACGLPSAGGTGLFQWVVTPQAAVIHDRLARQGILTRIFSEPSSLRFGLPGAEKDLARLATAMSVL